uniref:Transmembrane protein n=2 Tax=Medicago truncatula TaxID=3880 RepID=I3SEJ6_MEDTR|nr:unknown [Medicago truncatula]
MSSSHFITLLVLYLVFLLNSLDTNMAARIIPSSAPSTVTRPLFGETNYLKPHLDHKQKFFQGRQVKNCLPKGYRHNSAPSRFVNYDTLGGCSGIHSDKP